MSANVDRRFRVLDALEATDLREEIERRLREPAPRLVPPAPSPWKRGAAIAVAILVFAVASLIAWEAFDRDRRERPALPSDPWSWAPEGWTELPLPPDVRDGAAIVWTPGELVYWGGERRATGEMAADGFSFDPATRTWRLLPPAPIAGGGPNVTRDERGGAKAVWTGSEVLLWDVQTGDGSFAALAFDPATGRWRQLDDPPDRPTCCGAWAWTGTQLVVFGGGERDAPTTVRGTALDPSSGTWREIAPAPMGVNLANAVWNGDEVVVVGSELNARNIAETPTAIALAYRPETDSWRRLADPPLSPQASEAVGYEGNVISWDYGADSARYLSAQDRWQALGPLPLDHGECYVHGVAIRGAVFAWNCGIPDAWYPGVGWTDVEGGPPARQAEIDETFIGSQGRAIAAGSVAVIEQVDNVLDGRNLTIGASDAPMHLWVWRPLTAPQPPAPDRDDAEHEVSNFLLAWGGTEVYLPTLATQDVIDRCREGSGGCAPLGGGDLADDWRLVDIVGGKGPGTFEVSVDLLPREGPHIRQVFLLGPGVAADGGDQRLVVLDAWPG